MHSFPRFSALENVACTKALQILRPGNLFRVLLCSCWLLSPLSGQADEVNVIRNEANQTLRDLESRGYVAPTLSDLSKYPARTIRDLKTVLDGQSDDCLKAVAGSLFLDAHRREASVEAAVEDLQNTNLIRDLADIWGMSLLAEINPNLQVDLQIDPYMFLQSNLADSVSSLSGMFENLHKTVNAFVDHNREAIANSREVWIEDIIRVSTLHNWNENTVAGAQEKLRAKVAKAHAGIQAAEVTAKAAIPKIEERFQDRLSRIASARDVEIYKLDREINSEAAYNIKLGTIQANFVAANQEARDQRVAEFKQALQSRQHMISLNLQRIAMAHVQSQALARYALPIARGECDKITKTGFVHTPISCKAGDFLCELTRLPHGKLMSTFKALGVTPSVGYLNCVCRAAGYGSSGASQFYEPDTIGTFDARYSCQHPGPPCIVSGLGCTRHPLPTDPEKWKNCGARVEAEGKPNPFQAVEAGIRARAAEIAGKNND
ncbi:hypothetical protein [Pseudophaeobacter arcticus]|uniref:hypothetical protein n=1 Tax=Pseudophaeobacter arcticus TaxID=385492 RepID=UPI00249200D0|nr:hypothetical protein [Pseudophaeobacter arcticus]